jgi:hypothetical protein
MATIVPQVSEAKTEPKSNNGKVFPINFNIFYSFFTSSSWCVFTIWAVTGTNKKKDKKVVCYLSGWSNFRLGDGSYHVDKADPYICTHIVYTFAGLDINGNIISLDYDNDIRDSK